MKKGLWLILALALLWPCKAMALEAELESILDATQAQYDLSAWEESYGKLPAQVQDLWGHGDINSLIAGFARGEGLEAQGLLEGLWETVKATLAQGLGSLASIIGIALLTGLLDALLGEKQTNVKEIASFLCYSVCVMILSALLADQLAMTAGVIQELCGLLETVSPLLVTLLAAIGATASAGMVQPMFVLLSGTVAKVVQSVLLPGVMGAGVLYIVGALAGREQVTHLANIIKSFVKWAMGGITTVFLGAMALGGMSAGGVDSISFRTMKYTLDKSLPLVGGVVAGSLDSVRGCTILIKNAAGMAGVVMALGVVLMPLLQLMGMSLAFQLTGALCAQVSDSRMPKMLTGMADICRYMFACAGLVALMFVLTMGLVVALGSGG